MKSEGKKLFTKVHFSCIFSFLFSPILKYDNEDLECIWMYVKYAFTYLYSKNSFDMIHVVQPTY